MVFSMKAHYSDLVFLAVMAGLAFLVLMAGCVKAPQSAMPDYRIATAEYNGGNYSDSGEALIMCATLHPTESFHGENRIYVSEDPKKIYLQLGNTFCQALVYRELPQPENPEPEMTCGEYCQGQNHILCIGTWNISGTYPDCKCEFNCDTTPEEPPAQTQGALSTDSPIYRVGRPITFTFTAPEGKYYLNGAAGRVVIYRDVNSTWELVETQPHYGCHGLCQGPTVYENCTEAPTYSCELQNSNLTYVWDQQEVFHKTGLCKTRYYTGIYNYPTEPGNFKAEYKYSLDSACATELTAETTFTIQ
jgi:hypothetical protein